MKHYERELERFLHMYVKSRSILLREEPHAYASRIFELFSLLFFPSTEVNFLEGLKEKALYNLWSIVMSNTLGSVDKSKDTISDSLQVVTKYRYKMNYSGKTESGQIMHDLIQRFYNLPSGPNRKIAEELLFLDLARVINGFDYERIIQKNDMITTLSEYMECGAVTADLRIFLDIDIAIFPYNLNLYTIGEIRKAYRWFNLAFLLSSDIAAFEREFFVEESCNAVILYGQERGVFPRNVFRTERAYKKRLYERVTPSLIDDIENKGRVYLDKSVECLEKIREIDMSGITRGFTSLFEDYLKQRTSSPPAT